jgi:hypothetical protein
MPHGLKQPPNLAIAPLVQIDDEMRLAARRFANDDSRRAKPFGTT